MDTTEPKHIVNPMKPTMVEIMLQLGDVIQLTSPTNENLNEQTFIIDYIDKTKAYLINVDSLERIKVKINSDGVFGDGNISKIVILSRADSPSYARQNGLLPDTWINIYFGGELPIILTGEITNLEEDMIEVNTTDGDKIYINFDYKGLPEDLPIESIEIRTKPNTFVRPSADLREKEYEAEADNVDIAVAEADAEDDDVRENFPEMRPELQFADTKDIQFAINAKDVKNQLREFVIKADQIKFGKEELGPIAQYVDVSEQVQRYSIEAQVSDLLDDLLSTIPNAERTPRVLNNIHYMIEQFKHLREAFSRFDKYGNVEGAIVKEATYKPLKNWLMEFNINLYWLLPTVKNIKKIYPDTNDAIEEDEEQQATDSIYVDLDANLNEMREIISNYKSNQLPQETNAYSALYSELDKYFIPFNPPDSEQTDAINSIIYEKQVKSNINVIVNNLEDMYSTIFHNNSLRNRRFVISRYKLGETKLELTADSTNTKMVSVRVPLNDADTLSLHSLITLPEPTIRFSKINLPGTTILERANLNQHFLNYWQLLKKKTPVSNIYVDRLNDPETNKAPELEFEENTYASGFRNYVMSIPPEDIGEFTKEQLYERFASAIVPKIRVLFGLMKKYIKGKLSIVDVVSYLEPFLVYPDDLTFKQYQEITQYIDGQISEYNKHMVEMSKIFKMLSNVKPSAPIRSRVFSLMEQITTQYKSEVIDDAYGFRDIGDAGSTMNVYSNSETLKMLYERDYSKLYTTTISVQNIPLMFPSDINQLIETDAKETKDKEKNAEKDTNCAPIVISKMYTSLDELEADNNVVIYFDKKYDKTNYGIMEDMGGYGKDVMTMEPERLRTHIINDQMKKHRLNEADATYVAETLIDGAKRVIDGQYALFYKGYSETSENETDYYVRKNNKWELDETMSKTAPVISDDTSLFCDLNEKCISNPKATTTQQTCQSIKETELGMQNTLLRSVLTEFDTKYFLSKENFEKEIKERFQYFMSIMPLLTKIDTSKLMKYNNQMFQLGLQGENDENQNRAQIRSPFSNILDLILKQNDFPKKQYDIIRFTNQFTRPYVKGYVFNGFPETEHWLYCVKTNVPLLPTFKKDLADAFIKSEYEYQERLLLVISDIGKLSDDGDWWTDKHTGWPICPVDFDTEEGFEESGYKASSRAVIEGDAGSKINAPTEPLIRYVTPEAITINNVVNALSIAMGINIETQKEFIINGVVETLRNTVESEAEYKNKVKEAANKGKRMPSYRDFFNMALLYYTLGMYLIGVQTTIPSVKTRKTHPGCVRSFSGFPFEGTGDMSSLEYLACVTYDIRDSGEPWNVLKKTTTDKIQLKIKATIEEQLLQLPEVKMKMEEKTKYLLTAPPDEIPAEHDIANWTDFLPPLVPFNIRHLTTISDEFKRSLLSDLRNGVDKQREKILVIESKIIQFSLAIQEKIQDVVKNQRVILHTANNQPYLENSCCDTKDKESTVDYFIKHSKAIEEYNEIVNRLTNLLDDITSNTKANLFFCPVNDKNNYPPLSNTFDEKTIYLAFIFYCKFKSLMPMPNAYLPICTSKPDKNLIDPSDTIDRIILKLKEDGRNYTNEQFLRLIQLVSRENMVNITTDNPIISSVAKLSALIESMNDENNDEEDLVERSLRDLIIKAIDTFDVAREDSTKEVKDLNNFLITHTKEMQEEIIEFIQNNYSSSVTKNTVKKCVNSLKELPIWKCDDPEKERGTTTKISNDGLYSVLEFYKTNIKNVLLVFPSIVANAVNYKNLKIPRHYDFSSSHELKLKKYIEKYFSGLNKFYSKQNTRSVLSKVLIEIQKQGRNLTRISENTPCFANIKLHNKVLRGVIDERTGKYLFEYYLYRALLGYIQLSDNTNMLVIEKTQQVREEETITTVEHLEDDETRTSVAYEMRTDQYTREMTGNKKQLKQQTADLLIAFIDILSSEKDIINVTYEDVQDRVFKLKEKEKNMVTDRLKAMTDEERNVDTMMKVTKQGLYSKGTQKGFSVYDKDFYEDEQNLRDEMLKAERKIRKQNKGANDSNIDVLLDEYLDEQRNARDIDNDAFDMSYMNDDYYDGNVDGFGAPEEDAEDYGDYN